MNILHLRASNFYGGPERQLHFHARECVKNSVAITIGSFSEQAEEPRLLDICRSDGIATVCFSARSAYDIRVILNMKKYFRSHCIDIVCTHDYRSAVLVFLAVIGTRCTWISFSRGFTEEDLKTRLFHRIEHLCAHFSRQVVAVSKAQKEKLVRLGMDEHKITVVSNCVDSKFLEKIPAVDLHGRFGFPSNVAIAVSAGRFSPEKGQNYFVDAAISCLENQLPLRFILFGNGPDLDGIRQRIFVAGWSNEIVCPGFELEMLGCIKGADILVNPSLSEGMPNVVLEAMALGTAVVATDVGGVGELIDSKVNGLLVNSGDAEELAIAIGDMGGSFQMRKLFAKNAFEKVRDKFTFKAQFELLMQVYRRSQKLLTR